MSIRTEVQEIPARRETRTVEWKCELCQSVTKSSRKWPNDRGDNVNEVTVEFEFGSSYPEGGFTRVLKADICPQCFQKKLLPWIRSQGGDIREVEKEF